MIIAGTSNKPKTTHTEVITRLRLLGRNTPKQTQLINQCLFNDVFFQCSVFMGVLISQGANRINTYHKDEKLLAILIEKKLSVECLFLYIVGPITHQAVQAN